MFDILLGSKDKALRDSLELDRLKDRFGDDAINVLAERAQDRGLKTRDRRHWKRILKRAQLQQA